MTTLNKKSGDQIPRIEQLEAENQELKARLEETQEALRAISSGEVDALVVYGDHGERIYTLQGADYAYRVMVESLHEGAAYVRPDGMILYANKHMAKLLDIPLEQVLSSSFHLYILTEEGELFDDLLHEGLHGSGSAELHLARPEGQPIPVLINASPAEVDEKRGVCLAVTDLSEQKQAAARERELQQHLADQREEERLRIARNLHDGPLQDLIGLSYTIQALTASEEDSTMRQDLTELREVVLKLASDLRAVTNELRPPNAIRFGLAKAIRYLSDELQAKTREPVIHLELDEDGQAIPKEVTTALFRIFQEAMNNIYRHSQATEVRVRLVLQKNHVTLEVQDNGIGFQTPIDWTHLAREGHLGLVGIRERAEVVGGKIKVLTGKGEGTTVRAEVGCEFNLAFTGRR